MKRNSIDSIDGVQPLYLVYHNDEICYDDEISPIFTAFYYAILSPNLKKVNQDDCSGI